MPECHCGCLCSYTVYISVTARERNCFKVACVCQECVLTENWWSGGRKAQSVIGMIPGLSPHAAKHLPKHSRATTILEFLHVSSNKSGIWYTFYWKHVSKAWCPTFQAVTRSTGNGRSWPCGHVTCGMHCNRSATKVLEAALLVMFQVGSCDNRP